MQIRNFHVKNYRSLKDVRVGDLASFVTFYGDNDSGKSNVLSFLETLFKTKYSTEEIQATTETLVQQSPTGFWRGEIDNFSDSFYQNTTEPITFSITVIFERKEILELSGLPEKLKLDLPPRRKSDILILNGKIVRKTSDKAEIFLLNAEFNHKTFYAAHDASVSPEFLSGFDDISPAEKRDAFNKIMSKLDNLFLRIPTDRFLVTEFEKNRSEKVFLAPGTLKNWLFQISHDRDEEKVARQILEQFNGQPFEHGYVSIVRTGDTEIEAFVEDKNGFKLPIGRRGSGVQQILMILSYIIQSKAPIVGIEELEINLSPKTQALIFNDLLNLVNQKDGIVKQIFLTSHSPHIAKRNEATRRGVWMKNGETHAKRPSEAEVTDFFRH